MCYGCKSGQIYSVNRAHHNGAGDGYFEYNNSKGPGNGGSGLIIIRITESP